MTMPGYDADAHNYDIQPPDYDDFRLLRDAALAIGDRSTVLPKQSWHNVNFNAVSVQTDLDNPGYAPICFDVEVGWKKYGRKENLSVRLSETVLGTDTADQSLVQLFGITTKNDKVVHTWQSRLFPGLKDIEYSEGLVELSEVIDSIAGKVMLEEALDTTQIVTRYDCRQLGAQLLQFHDED